MKYKSLLVLLGALLLWFAISRGGIIPSILLPPPSEVFQQLFLLIITGDIFRDLGASLGRLVVGFVLAVIAGTLIGLLMGSYRQVRRTLEFPIDSLRSIPATALFPLFMIVLGVGTKSNIALIAYPCIWIMTINTLYGVQNSSRVRKQIAMVFKASRSQQFFRVTLPDALPYIATGLRLSIAVALHMAIVAEMFTGTSEGLGRRIFDAQMLLRVPEMYALIILTGVMGYVLNIGWLVVERRLVHWAGR